MPSETGKVKALETTLASLKKRFGEGAIMKLGDATNMKIDAIPTGSISLDLALGIGGIPRGRVTEIYGPEASGKTTICQHIIAEAQKMESIGRFAGGVGCVCCAFKASPCAVAIAPARAKKDLRVTGMTQRPPLADR